ncbi:MAG: cobalamin B12-binding domain-containing protein [Pseudomonadota bacterium]
MASNDKNNEGAPTPGGGTGTTGAPEDSQDQPRTSTNPADTPPERTPACESAPDFALLVRAVETEVIPRLLAAHHRSDPSPPKRALPPDPRPQARDIEALSEHAIASDTTGALALIEALIARGAGPEAVYLDLLGATAARLGKLWEEDEASFFDVSLGLCTLQQVLFRLPPLFERPEDALARATSPPTTMRRALFAPVPGETHVFGALIVAKFFARAGWRTWTEMSIDDAGLIDFLQREPFEVVGFSIALPSHADTLARTIAALRRALGAAAPAILVGGGAVVSDPDLARRVGADGSAVDPAGAVALAERLVDAQASRGARGT